MKAYDPRESELYNHCHCLGAKFVMLMPGILTDTDDPDTAMLGFVFPIERNDDTG